MGNLLHGTPERRLGTSDWKICISASQKTIRIRIYTSVSTNNIVLFQSERQPAPADQSKAIYRAYRAYRAVFSPANTGHQRGRETTKFDHLDKTNDLAPPIPVLPEQFRGMLAPWSESVSKCQSKFSISAS